MSKIDPLEEYHAKRGLVWKGERYLDTWEADELAHEAGLSCAEKVVGVLAFRSTPAGKCFQERLNAAGPDFYGLRDKQRIRVECTVAELFQRQESGVW